MQLNEKALTVNLNISQWTCRKYDRRVSSELEQQKDAHNAVRVNKLLISNDFTKDIQSVVTKAREFHRVNTLPWDDNGGRLLPSENMHHYMREMDKISDEFRANVTAFIDNYDSAINDARKRLKGMFDEREYPTRSELYTKFKIKILPMPIPDSDFRVTNLSEDEIQILKKSVEDEIQERLSVANQDLWARVKEQLIHMKDRLGQEVKDKKGYFRNSMFENLKELIDVLPRLNINNDSSIVAICEELKGLLIDPDEIRGNELLRQRKAEEVDQLMNKFSSFFN